MTRAEQLTRQFFAWEERGRGWQVFAEPVSPEPPFVPFYGHYLPETPLVDDGRKATVLSSWVQHVSRTLSGETVANIPLPEEAQPEPERLAREALSELVITLPPDHPDDREIFGQFLANLTLCREPITFELIATPEAITPLIAAHPADAILVRQQFSAYFPEAILLPQDRMLEKVWNTPAEPAIAEFGLAREFMLPLKTGDLDLFIGLASAVADLEPDEAALFQVIFLPVRHPWAESIARAVTDADGEPFFLNHPELWAGTRRKLASPLYAAVVRLAAKSADYSRAWDIVRQMSGALVGVADSIGNELIPLHNDEYPSV